MTTAITPKHPGSLLEEWPALGSSTADKREASSRTEFVNFSSDDDDDDWEDLEAATDDVKKDEDIPGPPEQAPPPEEIHSTSMLNAKILKHCASSPNLRCLADMKVLANVMEEEEEESPEQDTGTDGAESYSMVSSVASVHSMSTTRQSLTASTRAPLVSWKDKVAKLASDGDNGSLPATKLSSNPRGGEATSQQVPSQKSPPRKPTRYIVVKPMKRCTKSTGDLPSLAEISENQEYSSGAAAAANNSSSDDDDVMGDTDAMEFYHRKALGFANRKSGLRLRPDEFKRKQFTLQKKHMQRTGQ